MQPKQNGDAQAAASGSNGLLTAAQMPPPLRKAKPKPPPPELPVCLIYKQFASVHCRVPVMCNVIAWPCL